MLYSGKLCWFPNASNHTEHISESIAAMTHSHAPVDALIREIRAAVHSGSPDIKLLRARLSDVTRSLTDKGTYDDRLDEMFKDLKTFERWEGENKSIESESLKEQLYVFSDDAFNDDSSNDSPDSNAVILSADNLNYNWRSDAEPVASPITSGIEAVVASAPPAIDDQQADLRDYIDELDKLDEIGDPSRLKPDKFVHYQEAREKISTDRALVQEQRRIRARDHVLDPRYSLDEVVAALDALLDTRLTYESEEQELRTLRDQLHSTAPWTPEKSARYLSYFVHTDKKRFPSLDDRWKWLREQRTTLEVIIQGSTQRDQIELARQMLEKAKPEIEKLANDIGKMGGRIIDFDYLGTYENFLEYDVGDYVTDPHDPAGSREIRVGDLLPRLLFQYAEHAYNQAQTQLEQAVGAGARFLLDQLARRKPDEVIAQLTLNRLKSLDEISKAIRLGLINLAPTRYLNEFPGLVDDAQRRTRDPDPNLLTEGGDKYTPTDRTRFMTMRNELLPELLKTYERVQTLTASSRLTDLYELTQVWAHFSVDNRLREREESDMRPRRRDYNTYHQQLELGDIWQLYTTEDELQEYIDRLTSAIDSADLMNITLPERHPHADGVKTLKAQLQAYKDEYRSLSDQFAQRIKRLESARKRMQDVSSGIERRQD